MFQTWIACDVTANEVIRQRSMYSCTAWTDCICNQECFTKRWLLELLNNHHHYEESQNSDEDDDENKALEAI